MKQTVITITGKGAKIEQALNEVSTTAKLTTNALPKKWIAPLEKMLAQYFAVNYLNSIELEGIISVQMIPSDGGKQAAIKVKANCVGAVGQVPILIEPTFGACSIDIVGKVDEFSHNYFMVEFFNICQKISETVQERLPEILSLDNSQQNLFENDGD